MKKIFLALDGRENPFMPVPKPRESQKDIADNWSLSVVIYS